MTARTDGQLPRIPGVRYADHVAFTVPDLDEAVRFFVEALGARGAVPLDPGTGCGVHARELRRASRTRA